MSVTVLADETPLSRIIHRCEVCGGTIGKGEHYRRQRNICDGEPYVWKAHLLCDAAMTTIWRAEDYFYDEGPDPAEARELVEGVWAALTGRTTE